MKIRQGFVSNSSSSSFCIIGVCRKWINELAVAEGKCFSEPEPISKKIPGCDHKHKSKFCPECGAAQFKTVTETPDVEIDYLYNGVCDGKIISFYGNDEPYYAGVDAEKLLLDNSINQSKKVFADLVKKEYNLNIPLNDIGFHYGEVGNG